MSNTTIAENSNDTITVEVSVSINRDTIEDNLTDGFGEYVGYWAMVVGFLGDTSGVKYPTSEMPLRDGGAVLLISSIEAGSIEFSSAPSATGYLSCFNPRNRTSDEECGYYKAKQHPLKQLAKYEKNYDLMFTDVSPGEYDLGERCPECDEQFDMILALDREAVERGLNLMAQKYPKHFADLVSGSGDSNTSDAFIQLAVLGEWVYG